MGELATNVIKLMNKMGVSEEESQMFIKDGQFDLNILLEKCVESGILSKDELGKIEQSIGSIL